MPIMSEDEHRYNQLMKTFESIPDPAFESDAMQELVWGRRWGCPNDVGTLRMVLVHRPGDEVNLVDPTKYIEAIGSYGDVDEGWYWRGAEPPDLHERSVGPSGPTLALVRGGEYIRRR